MEKELGTATQVVTADLSGGFNSLKAAVYNSLGKFFSWLSTHQGIALIAILIILVLLIWFFLRLRNHGKRLENQVSSKDTEIGKKNAHIGEQKNQIILLQKKLSDLQGAVSEALLNTLKNLTGYDIDKLQIFFKFLTEIKGNPLQIADTQANTTSQSQWLEEAGEESAEENDATEKIAAAKGSEEAAEATKSGKE
jgi:hypothetical protein